jgi:hypothetical protein
VTAVAYIPGAVRFAYPARERRTATYRTWHGTHDMDWCAECLLCGQWSSSHATRAEAVKWAAGNHPGWCHVAQGCHCYWPHITAAMGARLGIVGGKYPRHVARVLFRMAGGHRKHRPPVADLNGTLHGRSEG